MEDQKGRDYVFEVMAGICIQTGMDADEFQMMSAEHRTVFADMIVHVLGTCLD